MENNTTSLIQHKEVVQTMEIINHFEAEALECMNDVLLGYTNALEYIMKKQVKELALFSMVRKIMPELDKYKISFSTTDYTVTKGEEMDDSEPHKKLDVPDILTGYVMKVNANEELKQYYIQHGARKLGLIHKTKKNADKWAKKFYIEINKIYGEYKDEYDFHYCYFDNKLHLYKKKTCTNN